MCPISFKRHRFPPDVIRYAVWLYFRMWLWRAVDDEGEVLDMLVQKRRNARAAMKLLRKLLKRQGIRPETITTDKLSSYRTATRKLGLKDRHRPGGMRRTTGPRTTASNVPGSLPRR